jgi:hypothetical protein
MQSRMNNSTALDIYNMSFMEREIGLGKNKIGDKSELKNNLSVLIKFDAIRNGDNSDGHGYFSISRINQNDSEWEEIIQNNIQQSVNSGFIKNLVTYVYKVIKYPKYFNTLKCNEQSISFHYDFFGYNDLKNYRHSSIKQLIENYKKSLE